jgi:hypothetical protein
VLVKNAAAYNGKVGVEETITDVQNGRGNYNEVTHSKTEWDFPLRSIGYVGNGTRYSGKLGECNTVGSVSAGPVQAQGYTNSDPLWDSAENALIRATGSMQFSVQDSGLDLPTFLGELRDFSEIYRVVVRGLFAVKGKQATEYLRALVRRYERSHTTLKHAIDDMVTLDLMNQFAVKPLLADIASMFNLGRHLASQVARLQSAAPVPVLGTVHDSGSESSTSLPVNSYTKYTVRERWITAWAKVKYDLSSFPSMPAILADATGFDEVHRSIWELTRWSFLVDYIIAVGDWLNQFHGSFIQVPYTVLDEGYSIKFESTQKITVEFDSTGYLPEFWSKSVSHRSVTGAVKYTKYQRIHSPLPFGAVAMPTIQVPTIRQVANFAELVYLLSGRRRG